MEEVKYKIIAFWLRHFFLRRIAKRYPDFFQRWVCDITDNRLERRVAILRYYGDEEDKELRPLKFPKISIKMHTVERNVHLYHQRFIDKLISGK